MIVLIQIFRFIQIPTRAENVDSSSNMSEHLNENYTSKRILCPLKICNHQSERIEILYEHWNKEHANLRFPEMRNDSEYTYKTTKLTPQIQEQVRVPLNIIINYVIYAFFLY